MASFLLKILFLFPLLAQASELDLADCKWLSVSGQEKVEQLPPYSELKALAHKLGSKIEWVPNVSRRVRQLPFHPARMPVSASDEIVGWFDEYTTPALIILDREAGPVTLLHELRHAIQLGHRHGVAGDKVDWAIWKAKVYESGKNRDTVTEFIEAASEISAYSDELKIAKKCGDRELYKTAWELRREYVREFQRHYKILGQDSPPPAELRELYLLLGPGARSLVR
ncbi:MAG: hypothetical protein A2X86_01995 [Bdellovibrionales bacterium GWA2_49_15]|nr:MAG: hypothetical protein A2X86_01995 [Bdellovibrionales bacterium GWA2_49_15]